MTPEQFNQVIQALNQGNWRLLYVLIVVVVAWLVAWLVVMAFQLWITKRIEAAIENKQHFNRVRYEREMKVYEELWPRLCEFQEAVLSLRPVLDTSLQQGETIVSRNHKRAETFTVAFTNFRIAIKYNRPFYPPIIWDELGTVLKLCWGEAVDFSIYQNQRTPGDYWEKAMNNAEAINKQIDKTCEAIRKRLSEFDSI